MALILVVEDDVDARDFLQAVVRKTGHNSLMLGSAEEAMRAIRTVQPDLALLDINLPGDSGVSLCWEIRQSFPEIPIVVMSALLEAWDEDDIRDCGANLTIAKPIDVRELLAVMEQYLTGEDQDDSQP